MKFLIIVLFFVISCDSRSAYQRAEAVHGPPKFSAGDFVRHRLSGEVGQVSQVLIHNQARIGNSWRYLVKIWDVEEGEWKQDMKAYHTGTILYRYMLQNSLERYEVVE